MNFRQLKNENGLTLIELLAAISLFAILLVLSSTLIVQLAKSEEKTSDSISLQQETNVLMAEIRSQYYNGESTICFKESNKIINKVETMFINGERKLSIIDGCVSGVNSNEILSIQLTTKTEEESFFIETTLSTKEDYVLNLEENPENFALGDMNENCVFNGNTKFNDTLLKNKKNEECQNEYLVKGSAAFLDDLTIKNKVKVTVEGNFYIFGTLDFKGSKGALCIKKEIKTKNAVKEYSIRENAKSCFEPSGYDIYVLK